MKITKEQQKQIKSIAKKNNLIMVLVFGSFATSKTHRDSDIDIAIKIKQPVNYLKFSELLFDFQEIFPKNEVDLAIINYADPLFLKKITETANILYGSPRELAELKIYAFKKYIDHQKYFKMEKDFVDKFLRQRKRTA